MANITLKGNPITTCGELPETGTIAANFTLVKQDLSETSLEDYRGQRVILNIFPSIDTPTCQTSVRMFNQKASSLKNTVVLCISADLPFAQARFCGAENIEKVITASSFRSPEFGQEYGLIFNSGPLTGLLARAIVVIDTDGKVIHTELVPELTNEPNYGSAIHAL